MGSVEVLRDHHNLLDDPPHLQRARMADQLYHSLDRLRMPKAVQLQVEPGRASPVQIKKKLRRLSEGLHKYPLDARDAKENESLHSHNSSRTSSASSTLSRPILKRKYMTSTVSRPKHVQFLSDVTVFQMGQDGKHECTLSEQLNTEPSSRITYKTSHFPGYRTVSVRPQEGMDISRTGGRPGGAAVVTHAVLDKPGKGKVGIGAVVTQSGRPGSPLPKSSNYAVTVSTSFPSQTLDKFETAGQSGSDSRANTQIRSIPIEITSSKPSPSNPSSGKSNPSSISSTKSNPNHSSNHKSNPQPNSNSSSYTNGSNSHNNSNNSRNLNISFTQDPVQGTKLKFVVGIGQGYDPEDIVVKANMNGSRIRVMATKVVPRPDGSNDVQQFNERFVLPMDIDPFTVDARLDTKGLLTVEAPLMTLERRQSLVKSDSKSDSSQTADLP